MPSDKMEKFQSALPDAAIDLVDRGKAMQQIKTTYTTAVLVQVKRNRTEVLRNVLEEV